MVGPIPSRGRALKLERHARRIQDPVERLRYLRRHASDPQGGQWVNIYLHRVRYLGWTLIMVLLPTSERTTRGSAEMFARERLLLASSADSPRAPVPASRGVWLVEHSGNLELYSNGLRIDLTFAVSNRPRAQYPIFSLNGAGATGKTGTAPVGIVYHTTESNIAPFEEDENHRLRQLGRNLLEWTRQERSYHYVIDRFGRVFRIVDEADAAFHAGKSVWADADGVYVNLNDSFLGVAFEAETDAAGAVTPAQISSAKVLTEMLRARYGIPAANCVTHAQVSVNPLNMHIGDHTDWAGNFPFAALGLPDNYLIPLPSLYVFGFEYDDTFLRVAGGTWKGVTLAVDQVAQRAAAEGLPLTRYRAALRQRYREIAAALKDSEQDPQSHSEIIAAQKDREVVP